MYGPAARGNWALLQRLARSGLPLPFGSVDNRRTLIGADNLVSALFHVANQPNAGISGTYMVSDGETVSLRQILIALRDGMGIAPRLFNLPPSLLRGAFAALANGGSPGAYWTTLSSTRAFLQDVRLECA